MQCFMKKEDKSLIDVEHVETTVYRRKVLPSELTNAIEQFIVKTFIGMKHLSPTLILCISCQCIRGCQHLQKHSPKCNFP